jgi:hypothetical protein
MASEMFLERESETSAPIDSVYNDQELLDMFKRFKRESFENRWIWERGWMRNIHFINNRHWVEYHRRTNEWRDVRLAKWFPKPVTPMIANGVRALRAMFAAVDIGVNVRPNGADPKNVAVAAIADDYAPVLHEEHDMEAVFDEGDFWFIGTGNVFYHTFLERDVKHGVEVIEFEQCLTCQAVVSPKDVEDAGQKCPECGGVEFTQAMDPETGAPLTKEIIKGKGVTTALSPFELAFPSTYARFDDVPYVIRLRWRSKTYYENHPQLKTQTAGFVWAKAPAETSLQLFRSLPYHNDMGVAPFLGNSTGQASDEEGAPEYEVWIRPCDQYRDGLVFRVLGDSSPIILHLEDDEAIPGPIPYTDAEGKAVFTFTHAAFEQRGGRIYGTGPIDAAIQKQNQLNQLDAFILMIINRMGNPLWLVPKGAEIEKFTGEPGLVVKWNPLTVGSTNAKPERVDGAGPNASLFNVREQYVHDIEEALGTSDVLKGSKPAGVEAFAALQLLVERGQSQFASAFKARGRAYRDWFKFALEIEREFGPDERTKWVLSPARTWQQQIFKNAQLQGSFSIIVEEGSQTPKTALGIRAAIQHLSSLGFIDAADPDQRYAIYQAFGQTKLSPSLDIHMQAALRKQQAFEEWVMNPQAVEQSMMQAEQAVGAYEQQLAAAQPPPTSGQIDPKTGMEILPDPATEQQQMAGSLPPPPSPNAFTPLKWRPWYKADIHKQEFLKWANSDRIVEMVQTSPNVENLLVAHLADIDMALMQMMMMAAGPPPIGGGGGGQAMANSNQEAGGTDVMPGSKGAAQEATT